MVFRIPPQTLGGAEHGLTFASTYLPAASFGHFAEQCCRGNDGLGEPILGPTARGTLGHKLLIYWYILALSPQPFSSCRPSRSYEAALVARLYLFTLKVSAMARRWRRRRSFMVVISV